MAVPLPVALFTENDIGIKGHVNDCKGFPGVLKQKWEDFHVYEVDNHGNLLRLTEILSIDDIRREITEKKKLQKGEDLLSADYTIPSSICEQLLEEHRFAQQDITSLEYFLQITMKHAIMLRSTIKSCSTTSEEITEASNTQEANSSRNSTVDDTCNGCDAQSNVKPLRSKSMATDFQRDNGTIVKNTTMNKDEDENFHKSYPQQNLHDLHKKNEDENNIHNISQPSLPMGFPPRYYILPTAPREETKPLQHNSNDTPYTSLEQVPTANQCDGSKSVRKRIHEAISRYFPFLYSQTITVSTEMFMSAQETMEKQKKQQSHCFFFSNCTLKSLQSSFYKCNHSTVSLICVMFKPPALNHVYPREIYKQLGLQREKKPEQPNTHADTCEDITPHSNGILSTQKLIGRTAKGRKRKLVQHESPLNDSERTLNCFESTLRSSPQTRWPKSRPPYLFFHLYKVNRDTAEAIQMISRCLHVSAKAFTYAGTKDRRAITVQGVTAYHVTIEQLQEALLHPLWDTNVKVSNLCYTSDRLHLGHLQGNHFCICIRDLCPDAESQVKEAVECLRLNGFVNFFGPQRFGTRVVRTHHIGAALLQGAFQNAVHLILGIDVDQNSETNEQNTKIMATTTDSDMINDAVHLNSPSTQQYPPLRSNSQEPRIHYETQNWKNAQKSGDLQLALKLIPRHLYVERTLLQSLLHFPNDYLRALQQLPKNTLTLYIHAVQSLVWNHVASYRLRVYGTLPRVGDFMHFTAPMTSTSQDPSNLVNKDLLLAQSTSQNCCACFEKEADYGDSLDPINTAQDTNASDESRGKKRHLSAAPEPTVTVVKNDTLHSVTPFDILLPLPGESIVYPEYLKDVYEKVCMEHLKIHLSAIRANKSTGLGAYLGGYRSFILRPWNLDYRFVDHIDPNKILATDEALLMSSNKTSLITQSPKLELIQVETPEPLAHHRPIRDSAVLLSCTLPKSAYLTMACRELIKP